jgi:hypothetical protein
MNNNNRDDELGITEIRKWLSNEIYTDYSSRYYIKVILIDGDLRRYRNIPDEYYSNEYISSVLERINEFPNLEELIINNTLLSDIPESIGTLRNLKLLQLENNQIQRIPESISNLSNIIRLYLSNNQIAVLPDNIGNLYNLLDLDLGHNQLTLLPDSIGNCENLFRLIINFNHLVDLPDSIGNLYNLETLFIDSNVIITLPDSITRLNLNDFYFRDNMFYNDNATWDLLSDDIKQYLEEYPDGINREEILIEMQRAPVEENELPEGIAFEVHKFFKKIDKDKLINFIKPVINSEEINQILLYDNSKFIEYINNSLKGLIQKVNSNEKKRNIETDINRIFEAHLNRLDYSEFKEIIAYCIEYVKKQSKEFQETYITTFAYDCTRAYNGPSGMSCAKGILERFVTSLIPAAISIQTVNNNAFKDKKYETLISIIENKPMSTMDLINKYAEECTKNNNSINSNDKLISCVKNKLQEHLGDRYNNSISEEVNSYIPSLYLFGGKRLKNRKTFKKPFRTRKNKKSKKIRKTISKIKKSYRNKHKSKTYKRR